MLSINLLSPCPHVNFNLRSTSAVGTGPVDAVYKAIKDVVGRPNDLTHFSVTSVTDGQNALGEVTIRVAPTTSGPGKRALHGLKRIRGATETGDAVSVTPPASAYDDGDLSHYHGKIQYVGTAADKDIVCAAANAYVAALNRMLAAEEGNKAVVGAGSGFGSL